MRHTNSAGLRYIKPALTDNPSTWDEFYVDMEGVIRKNDKLMEGLNIKKTGMMVKYGVKIPPRPVIYTCNLK